VVTHAPPDRPRPSRPVPAPLRAEARSGSLRWSPRPAPAQLTHRLVSVKRHRRVQTVPRAPTICSARTNPVTIRPFDIQGLKARTRPGGAGLSRS
jgi:hypothetical protein